MRLRTVRQALVRVGFVTLLLQSAPGQETTTDRDLLELFNACRPVKPIISSPFDGDIDDRLRALVERRIRIARLYDEEWPYPGGFLGVMYTIDGWELDSGDHTNIDKARLRATARVFYLKQVTDEFGNSGNATTWESKKTFLLPSIRAVAAGDGEISHVFSTGGERAVSELLDEFIGEYLRANGEDCGSPAGAQP